MRLKKSPGKLFLFARLVLKDRKTRKETLRVDWKRPDSVADGIIVSPSPPRPNDFRLIVFDEEENRQTRNVFDVFG